MKSIVATPERLAAYMIIVERLCEMGIRVGAYVDENQVDPNGFDIVLHVPNSAAAAAVELCPEMLPRAEAILAKQHGVIAEGKTPRGHPDTSWLTSPSGEVGD